MWPFSGNASAESGEPARINVSDRIFHSGCVESRREVSTYHFRLFNKSVFNNKLPTNTAIFWNKRLLTTAGRCLQASIEDKRVAFIQLSMKICDTPERVRDTLLHEMCHAATWVLDGVQHTDHGSCFQYWAERANRKHPDLPPINSFHTYTIRKRFTYRCVQCKNRIDRHSKSIDPNKQVCGLCGGKFKLVENQHEAEGGASGCKTSKCSSGSNKSKGRNSSGRRSSSSGSGSGATRRRRGNSQGSMELSFADYLRDNKRKMTQRHPHLSPHDIVFKLATQFDKLCKG